MQLDPMRKLSAHMRLFFRLDDGPFTRKRTKRIAHGMYLELDTSQSRHVFVASVRLQHVLLRTEIEDVSRKKEKK